MPVLVKSLKSNPKLLSNTATKRVWRLNLFIITVCPAAVIAMQQPMQTDMYWLLAAGRWISNHGWTWTDPFPTVAQGRPWHNQQWLAEILFYRTQQLVGTDGLRLLYSLVLGLGVWVGWLISSGKHWAWRLFGIVFATASAQAVFSPRAGGLALLCFALLLLGINQAERRKVQFGIFLVMVLWANLHGSVLLGAALLWAYAAGTWLGYLLAPQVERSGLPHPTRYWQLAVLGSIACMCTPLGLDMFAYAFSVGDNPMIKEYVAEWMPAWKNTIALALVSLWAAGAVGLLVVGRKTGLASIIRPILVLLLFGLAALQASRNVVFLGLVLCWLMREVLPTKACTNQQPGNRTAVGATCLAVWMIGAVCWSFQTAKPNELRACVDAVAHSALIKGTLLMNTGMASYSLWIHPEQRVFVDGRLELFSPHEMWERHRMINAFPSDALPKLQHNHIAGVVTHNYGALPVFAGWHYRAVGHYFPCWILHKQAR